MCFVTNVYKTQWKRLPPIFVPFPPWLHSSKSPTSEQKSSLIAESQQSEFRSVFPIGRVTRAQYHFGSHKKSTNDSITSANSCQSLMCNSIWVFFIPSALCLRIMFTYFVHFKLQLKLSCVNGKNTTQKTNGKPLPFNSL